MFQYPKKFFIEKIFIPDFKIQYFRSFIMTNTGALFRITGEQYYFNHYIKFFYFN